MVVLGGKVGATGTDPDSRSHSYQFLGGHILLKTDPRFCVSKGCAPAC